MSASELDRLQRERLEADRAYNDALTAVDQAVVRPPSVSDVALPAAVVPPLPGGWRGRWLRVVHEWLGPVFARQQEANDRIAEGFSSLAGQQRQLWQELERFESILVQYLQTITLFVDTKDRHVAGSSADRIDRHEEALTAVAEFRAQMAVVQRAVQMLKRELQPVSAGASVDTTRVAAPARLAAPVPARSDDFKYVAFEDQFRGSNAEVREKQRQYVPIFSGAEDVVDIGCGRGEFLDLLRAEGIRARGVDVNREMVAAACERGLSVNEGDAVSFLQSLPDESVGGIMAAQVVEHLEPAYLTHLLDVAHLKLRPGAPIVIETINPACWLAFFSSYIRDLTHVRPIHPETLQYLLRASGFDRVAIRYSAPVPDHVKMRTVHLPTELGSSSDTTVRAVVEAARVVNENASILNGLMFSNLDYAAIGYRS